MSQKLIVCTATGLSSEKVTALTVRIADFTGLACEDIMILPAGITVLPVTASEKKAEVKATHKTKSDDK